MRDRLSWLGVGLGLGLLAIAACDHKPAPKKQPIVVKASGGAIGGAPIAASAATANAPAGAVKLSAAPGGAPAAPGGAPAPAPAPAAPAEGDLAQSCLQVGIRIADLAVSSANEQMRPQLEQARTDIVKSSSEACIRGTWSAEARSCFLGAKTLQDMDACKLNVPSPAPAGAAAKNP